MRYIPVASVGVWLLHARRDDFSSLAVFSSAHCARSFKVVLNVSNMPACDNYRVRGCACH